MKLFSSLMAVYIFSLALVPCGDLTIEHKEIESTYTHQHDNHENNTGEHKDCSGNDCSPFCFCACCHTAMTLQLTSKYVLVSTPYVTVSTEDHTFMYYDSPSSTYLNTIWQPPKILI